MTERLLDLSPERAEALIDAALERQHIARLHDVAGPLLAALPDNTLPMGELLLAELARLSARLDAVEQAQGAALRSKEELLRLDPLRFIPKSRLNSAGGTGTAAETGPVAIDAGSLDFNGAGWWPAEQTEGGSLRWSGRGRWASVALAALGGGDLLVTLSVRSPFGRTLDIGEYDFFLGAVPLTVKTLSHDGSAGVFEALARLPELPPGSLVTLLLGGAQAEDPATGPRRDQRRLGLGLSWLRLERVA